MEVKVHWIIDGIAEMDVETLEEAEQKVDEVLRAVIADNKELVELLGARAIQGKAYLPARKCRRSVFLRFNVIFRSWQICLALNCACA